MLLGATRPLIFSPGAFAPPRLPTDSAHQQNASLECIKFEYGLAGAACSIRAFHSISAVTGDNVHMFSWWSR